MISDDSFILAHISDPHLAFHQHIRPVDLLNKRFLGYMSWRLRRSAEHHTDVLDNLIEDIKANQPDHTVLTGDLTHLGLPAEFSKAKELLNALGTPSQVTVIPGNHDAYVDGALNGCLKNWIDYILSDQAEIDPGEPVSIDALFPSLRVRGDVALIGVCTARPCGTFMATGSMGTNQYRRLGKLLMETGQKGLIRVVLIHHPPVPGIVSWRKRLTDAKAFRSIVHQYGAELVLHGHAHRSSHKQLETPDGHAPVVGITSASASVQSTKRRARYHLYRLLPGPDKLKVDVTVRGYLKEEKRFVTEKEFELF